MTESSHAQVNPFLRKAGADFYHIQSDPNGHRGRIKRGVMRRDRD